ncbi:hypothetical protein ACFX13_010099 [Malus domestica]|uniref:BHLH domain-containing protein n=1 Tax=Malus domestica TaxID=3750 RepID=A0A498IE11_MALDO|nr:transcription factor bHLH140-like [Malus sylvestris]RXH81878.1 hypothetical protein DVH24_036219 [Malus domestica]
MDYFTATNDSSSNNFSKSSSSVTKNNRGGGKNKSKGVRLSTDPQSVAARERRHRISDRFKILQSLVPGGTKLDTVSMLEEAIHYVKFLKTQIWLHQSMINSVDDHHDPSPSMLMDIPAHRHGLHPTGCFDQLPPQHHQQTHDLFAHSNFVSAAASVQPPSPAVNIPIMPEYNCFQGQETLANIEAYMKYYS